MEEVPKATPLPPFTLQVSKTPPFLMKKIDSAADQKYKLLNSRKKKLKKLEYIKDLAELNEVPKGLTLQHHFVSSKKTEERFKGQITELRASFEENIRSYQQKQVKIILDVMNLELRRLNEDI